MAPGNPGDAPKVPLTPRLSVQSSSGWRVTRAGPMVLGDEDSVPVTAPLSLFAPAEPPIAITVQPVPGPAVLGEQAAQGATLQYQPTDQAVYVLLQEVHTRDGVIYDWTLPHRLARADGPVVLGDEGAPAPLVFPLNAVAGPGLPDTPNRQGTDKNTGPAVLGIEDVVGSSVGGALADVVLKRVLQVVKSPIDSALLATVRHLEPAPRVLAWRGSFQPLEGFDAWRALLPPGREQRVLLYVHGFASSIAAGGGALLVPQFASHYDAILAYDHPTLGLSPIDNARQLLDMIPDDLQLKVDLVAHSRGGLVIRSLVELLDWTPKLRPNRLLTAGSPHAGTRLADPEHWDRLVSMAMTLGSWLASIGGGAFWAPKLLEFVLKAAAQGIFSLPGLAAMIPGSDFLQLLNAPGAAGLNERVPYSAVTSSFAINNVAQQGFRQAFMALAVQAFMGEPNDLVVHTASALEIDKLSRTFVPGQQFRTTVDHGSYFQNPEVADFIVKQLSVG
jgi:pimeloyl-ACP methyl ester carboxylesterase